MGRRFRSTVKNNLNSSDVSLIKCFVLLAAFFICGSVLGIATGGYVSGEAVNTLSEVVLNYLGYINGESVKIGNYFSLLINAFIFPLLAFFFSTSVIGFLILPPLIAARGFYLGFSAASIIKVLGTDGKLLIFAAYGINALITVPCLFLISIHSMQISGNLFSSSIMGVKCSGIYGKQYFVRIAICSIAVFAATLLDTYLTPYLVRLAASLVN